MGQMGVQHHGWLLTWWRRRAAHRWRLGSSLGGAFGLLTGGACSGTVLAPCLSGCGWACVFASGVFAIVRANRLK
eukprot:9852974-Lingulodinium_polyedra.AAC.1